MGLRENPRKTQIIGRSKLDEVLRDGGPQNLKDSVTILGPSSVNRPRRMSDQEETRLSEAKKRAILLKNAGLGWSLHVKAFAAFVLSEAAYASHLLMSLLGRHLGTQHTAAKHLREMFYGPINELVSRRLGRIMKYMSKRMPISWGNKPYSHVTLLRKDLKELGFVEVAPFLWEVHSDWKSLVKSDDRKIYARQSSKQEISHQKHILREVYRRNCFVQFLTASLRDVVRLCEGFSDPELRSFYAEIDWLETKKLVFASGAHRAVLLGSWYSPAARERAMNPEAEATARCPFCKIHLGTFDHLMWNCPKNPFPGAPPRNPLERQFGWVTTSNAPLCHMASTVQKAWDYRFHGPILYH